MTRPSPRLLAAALAAGIVACATPPAHASYQQAGGTVLLRLTPAGLSMVSAPRAMNVAGWRPGSAEDIPVRLENATGGRAAVHVGATGLSPRSRMTDALRLSTNRPAWSAPLSGTGPVGHRLLGAAAGGSAGTVLRLSLPPTAGNAAQGGTARFALRFTAIWTTGSSRVSTPVAGGDSDSLAGTGGRLFPLLGMGVAAVLIGVAMRWYSRQHVTGARRRR